MHHFITILSRALLRGATPLLRGATPLLCGVAPLLLSGCLAAVVLGAVTTVDIAVDGRTVGRQLDDAAIELHIGQALYADPELQEQARIKATSVQGLVLLIGEVPNAGAALRAATLAAEVSEVRQVLNKTVVGEVASNSAQLSESWLITRAKARMIKKGGIRGVRANIAAHGDIIYLMGVVSRDEGDQIAQSIRHVKGISRIVKVFQYVEK